jgi:hypothetical protein
VVNLLGLRSKTSLEAGENIFAFDALVGRYRSKDCIQCSYAQAPMRRNDDSLRTWEFRLKNNVATFLVDKPVTPAKAESLHELFAAQVARKLHNRSVAEE